MRLIYLDLFIHLSNASISLSLSPSIYPSIHPSIYVDKSLSLLLTSPSPLGLFCLRTTYGATVSFIKPLGSSPFQHLNKELLLWIVPMRPHVGIGGSKCLGRKKDNSCGIRLNFGSVRDPYRPTSHKSWSFGHFTVCYGIDGASSSMIYSTDKEWWFHKVMSNY